MNFSDLELDALAEIFNVGVGQAANALSQLAGSTVRLSVPEVRMLPKRQIAAGLQRQDIHRICAVSQDFSGEFNTRAVLMFAERESLQLVQLMVGSEVPLEQLGEMEQEAMAEVGNILLNALVSGMADMLGLSFDGSLPFVDLGPVDQVLTGPENRDAMVLRLQIEFSIDAMAVQGYLAFLLDVASSDALHSKVAAFLESLS
ncbi:MAG: chemotaxis protein CheC [Rhodoferax sp.]